MKFLAAYIMKGRIPAMMVASSLALLSLLFPPVSIVSSASVALVTLRRGWFEGLYVLICSCLSAALLGAFLLDNFQFALLYSAVLWLPIWLISIVLREGKHLSIAVEIAVLLGVVGVIAFYLIVDEPVLMWRSILEQMLAPVLQSAPEEQIEQMRQSMQVMSRFMIGAIVAGSVYGLLFGLFLARWWQSQLYNPGGFRQEYLSLKVRPQITLLSLAVIVIAWLMSGTISEIGWNITILFFVLYTTVGTAILHMVFLQMKARRFLVPFLYLMLVMIPHVIALVAIIGVSDSWLNIRNIISNKTEV